MIVTKRQEIKRIAHKFETAHGLKPGRYFGRIEQTIERGLVSKRYWRKILRAWEARNQANINGGGHA